MAVQVLIVDDSAFFRRRISEILESDACLKVIGTASNGAEAVDKTLELKPDVIVMDIEMPVLDGISAVRRIMAARPTPILMFSSLTHDGAKATLDALEAGAVDYLPKRLEDIAQDLADARRVLCQRVCVLGMRGLAVRTAAQTQAANVAPALRRRERRAGLKLVVIGASTGGPVALPQVLTRLPKEFSAPLLIVQHMPACFTQAFARRLDQQCAIDVKEAQDGDMLRPGLALLAPGGRQTLVERYGEGARVRVCDSEPMQHYRPCVDISLVSAARVFGADVLAVIMTGMGADGREGARLLKRAGATVWTQDEASSVVYGMPMAVAEAGLSDRVLSLGAIGPELASGA